MNHTAQEYGLPEGYTPHNPANLTPDQVTEGGKYRLLATVEVDGEVHVDCCLWGVYGWRYNELGWIWDRSSTLRVAHDHSLPVLMASDATLRDEFAKAALSGLCANPCIHQSNPMDGWSLANCTTADLAGYALHLADAMLAARGKA